MHTECRNVSKEASKVALLGLERDLVVCVVVSLAGCLATSSIDRLGSDGSAFVYTVPSLVVAITCPIIGILLWKSASNVNRKVFLTIGSCCAVACLGAMLVMNINKTRPETEQHNSHGFGAARLSKGLR